MSIFCRLSARVTSRSWFRKIPERIIHRAAFSLGKISISNSEKRFAHMMSILRGNVQCRMSPTRNPTPPILFRRVFSFAVEIAIGSLSMPTTRVAPKYLAASARIPLPVPRSTIDQPGFHLRVSFSSIRSDIAVVACSPVPKAVPEGMKRWEGPIGRDSVCRAWGRGRDTEVPPTFTMSNRLPTLIDLFFCSRENRFNQSCGSFRIRPSNSLARLCNLAREGDATSSSNRLRPASSIIVN